MTTYWRVHMMDGRTISFNKRCHFIASENGVMYFMTDQIGKTMIAAIPIANILWVEIVEGEE